MKADSIEFQLNRGNYVWNRTVMKKFKKGLVLSAYKQTIRQRMKYFLTKSMNCTGVEEQKLRVM